MNVTNISLYSDFPNELVNFSFRDPRGTNSYLVKSITGLDAGDISSNFYNFGNVSLYKFYSMTLPKREIEIRVSLNPDYENEETVTSLRDRLYKAISSSRKATVELGFNNGNQELAYITGFVKKFEVDHFSKSKELVILLDCVDPTIKSREAIQVNEFSDHSILTVNDEKSTSPHGALWRIDFLYQAYSFTIRDEFSDWYFEVKAPTISGNTWFQLYDQLYISSVKDEKFVYLLRPNGAFDDRYELIDKISQGSDWPIIFPGDNQFYIDCPGVNSPGLNYEVGYLYWHSTYWGI